MLIDVEDAGKRPMVCRTPDVQADEVVPRFFVDRVMKMAEPLTPA